MVCKDYAIKKSEDRVRRPEGAPGVENILHASLPCLRFRLFVDVRYGGFSLFQQQATVDAGRQLPDIVADVDERRIESPAKSIDQGAEPFRLFLVQSLTGFVENEQGRVLDQGSREQGPALLARG